LAQVHTDSAPVYTDLAPVSLITLFGRVRLEGFMNRCLFRGALASLGVALLIEAATCQVSAQDGKLVDSAVVTLKDEDVKKLETAQPGVRDVLDRIDIKAITYLSDGLKVKGYLVVPKKGDRFPCVIYNRGGNRDFGALSDVGAAALLGRVASWGYVVVASQYRGNAGGEGQEEFGGKDVNDVLSLLPLLKSLPQADVTRVGMYGWSRGGMMTYLALARTDRIAAAVVGAGAADAFEGIKGRPEMEKQVFAELIPNYATDKEAALAARSAVRWPEKLHKITPILLLHGSADWRVPPTQALTMASKLYESKHPFRFVFFEGGDHGLSEHREEVDRLIREWLNIYVRDKKPWPSLEPHGR
jgi:dipeptidyl aminopeptidase/acylaminoacyl peptidase